MKKLWCRIFGHRFPKDMVGIQVAKCARCGWVVWAIPVDLPRERANRKEVIRQLSEELKSRLNKRTIK